MLCNFCHDKQLYLLDSRTKILLILHHYKTFRNKGEEQYKFRCIKKEYIGPGQTCPLEWSGGDLRLPAGPAPMGTLVSTPKGPGPLLWMSGQLEAWTGTAPPCCSDHPLSGQPLPGCGA